MYLGAMVLLRTEAYACVVSLTTMEQAMALPAINLQPSSAKLSFDGFELDEDDARLTCGGQPVPIAPRPFAVLCALARRPGQLVTKSDLLDAVWGHRFVTDSVLKSAISYVRAALQDDPRQPRYIETVMRRGYRFIVPPGITSAPRRDADDEWANPPFLRWQRLRHCAAAMPHWPTSSAWPLLSWSAIGSHSNTDRMATVP